VEHTADTYLSSCLHGQAVIVADFKTDSRPKCCPGPELGKNRLRFGLDDGVLGGRGMG